jgi:hypothetical protein
MTHVIRAIDYVRPDVACDFGGQYLEWFDPDIPDDREIMATFTDDLDRAKQFPDAAAAMAEWQRVRTVDPMRPDGRPNRPLTALTVSIEKVAESGGKP